MPQTHTKIPKTTKARQEISAQFREESPEKIEATRPTTPTITKAKPIYFGITPYYIYKKYEAKIAEKFGNKKHKPYLCTAFCENIIFNSLKKV